MLSLRLLPLAFLFSSCIFVVAHDSGEHGHAHERTGMQSLFDGKTTHGWRGYKQTSCPAGWQVVDGALTRVGEGGDLVSMEQYQDFEFDFEWKIGPGGNSGLMFHVTEDHDYPWETGPEFQILDNAGHVDGKEPRTSAGSNYAMHAPSADVTRPAGQWNQARLVVDGAHVEHWLNGTMVVSYELWSDDWQRLVEGSKWKERPDYGRRPSGHLALQDHGDSVAFRAMRIRRL